MEILVLALKIAAIALVLLPFIGVAAGAITEIYFKRKEEYLAKMTASVAVAIQTYSQNVKTKGD